MPATPAHSQAEIEAARYAELNAVPSSELAVTLCDRMARKLFHQRKCGPTRLQREAFGTIVADLLGRDPTDAGGWLYRSVSPRGFTGDKIGYRLFRAVFDRMDGPMIEVVVGNRIYEVSELTAGQRQPVRDRATRFRATPWLRDLFADQGITKDNWGDHFERSKPSTNRAQRSLLLRAHGQRRFNGQTQKVSLPFDRRDPYVASLVQRMDRLNAFLGAQEVEPFGPVILRRIFAADDPEACSWDCGGRLYTFGSDTYQGAKKEARSAITINGEGVVELDIQASHLTLLVGLGHLPAQVLDGDPYAVDGLPREIVKQWVNMTISHGSRHTRWPKEAKERFLEKHAWNLTKDFPLQATGDRILQRLPVIGEDGQAPLATWGTLQFVESEIVLRTMEVLAFDHAVPSLPVHDSIIVPRSQSELARERLKESFRLIGGVEPVVTG